MASEVYRSRAPLETEGAGKAGRRRAPAAPVRKKVHGVVTRGTAKTSRPSPHNGFNGLFRALRGDEFVLLPSLANWRRRRVRLGDCASASLTPATVPGPHGFAVRGIRHHQTLRCGIARVHRSVGDNETSAVRLRAGRSLTALRRAALRFRFAPDAAASTASHAAFVTIATRSSCRVGRRG